jgi:hypothetical protein
MRLVTVFLSPLVVCSSLLAEQPPEEPKELEPLGQYVGNWTSEVTSRPAVWTPKEVRLRLQPKPSQPLAHIQFIIIPVVHIRMPYWFAKC